MWFWHRCGAGGGMYPAVLPPLNPRPLDGDGITRLSPRIGGILSRALGRSATPAMLFNASV